MNIKVGDIVKENYEECEGQYGKVQYISENENYRDDGESEFKIWALWKPTQEEALSTINYDIKTERDRENFERTSMYHMTWLGDEECIKVIPAKMDWKKKLGGKK